MRRSLIGLCVLVLVLAFAVPAFAGGTINKSNLSAEYMGSYTRNASIDKADIVAYNPAGTVKLDDGLTMNLGLQYLIEKDYSNKFNGQADSFAGTDYNNDEPSLVPAFYTVYKQDRWAGFFGVNVPLGGGKVKYSDGNFTTYTVGQQVRVGTNIAIFTDPVLGPIIAPLYPGGPLTGPYDTFSHRIEAESVGMGYTFGGAYRINDMVSASFGLRYIDATTEFDGGATLISTAGAVPERDVPIEFEADATGWGGILGLDIFPSDKMTIGLRYETRTELKFKYDVKQGAAILSNLNIVDGEKVRDDLPATFGAGFGYQFSEKLRGEANFTYYFNTDANIGGATLREGLEDNVDDGWEFGISAAYAFTEKIKASAGYLYTSIGVDPDWSSKFLPDLDSHALGIGLQWTVMENLDLTFAAGNVFYVSDSYNDTSLVDAGIEATPTKVEYEKNIPYLGFGIQYKFF